MTDKVKIKYNYDYLQTYCKENNITLLKDYLNEMVNRDTIIYAKCIKNDCNENVEKRFRQLNEVGSFCIIHTKENLYKKAKSTEWKSNRIRFNNNYLKKYCEDNNIELLEDYSNVNINRESIIKAICLTENCNELTEKTFRNIVESTGCYCEKCTENIKVHKLKTTEWESNKIRFNNNYLKKYCDDNNIELLEDYSNININRETLIKGKCLTENCNKNFEKTFRRIIDVGSFCEKCTDNNSLLKSKNTCIEKYGVENVCHVPEIAEKSSKNSYRTKEYTFPSGNIIKCQGYEPYALNELIKIYKEEDIITGCVNVPLITYKDINGKEHKHYVDIFILIENKCIEVKSTWTAEKKKDNIFLKQEAGKKLGYQYEIWIYNEKKEKVQCHL